MKSFVEVAIPDVVKLLACRIGLSSESVGMPLIQAAVNDHMDELGLDDATAYVERLHGSSEFDELIERVVVPETWFFRDLEPFRFLQHFVREQWRPRQPGGRLRVLSVPCSSGEESYTVAITLLDLGLTPEQFRVDGVDISRESIQKARTGSFGSNSFREKNQILSRPLESFFRRHGEKSVIRDEVRAAARFTRANLAAGEFLPDVHPYDVIFCRNLLIYLVPEAREQALAHMRRLLQPGGFVYLGHAESGVASASRLEIADDRFPFAFRFASTDNRSVMDALLSPRTVSRSGEFFKLPFQPMVIETRPPVPATPNAAKPQSKSPLPLGEGQGEGMYRPDRTHPSPLPEGEGTKLSARRAQITNEDSKTAAAPMPPESSPTVVKQTRPAPKSAPPPRRNRPRPASAPAANATPKPPAMNADLLSLARAAADAGLLDEAAQHCQRLLTEASPLADAYCLLGTIRQAQGDFSAAEPYFQKAVYLDPAHHESLVHLSLLAQRRGDMQAAANFRRRADRAAKGNG